MIGKEYANLNKQNPCDLHNDKYSLGEY